ncbi:hypothetical protein RGL59_004517 [Vibrio parahaemolyticus]|nr:hypothetical protein [Vibrio parahaemolyticus]HCG7645024.1 hypothetical protein [Vibrio parahaemolyticus]HCH1833012.1 hypothetical protein [Vibrio parahaemolyticus]
MKNALNQALEALLRLGINRSERGAILGGADTETKAIIVTEFGGLLDSRTVRRPSPFLSNRKPIELMMTGDVVLITEMFTALKKPH